MVDRARRGSNPRFWLRGTDWFNRVEPELANVRAALDFARTEGDTESEIRLASEMRHYWRVGGTRSRGVAGSRTRSSSPALWTRFYERGSKRRRRSCAWPRASTSVLGALWLDALEIYRREGDTVQVGRMLSELGMWARGSGDPLAAIAYYEQARDTLADEDEEFLLQLILGNLADAYEQTGDLERARATALEGSTRKSTSGIATALPSRASPLRTSRSQPASSRRLGEGRQLLRRSDEVGFVEVKAYALGSAAALAAAVGAHEDGALLIGAAGSSSAGSAPLLRLPRRNGMRGRRARDCELDDAPSVIARGAELEVEAAVELAKSLRATSAGKSGMAR